MAMQLVSNAQGKAAFHITFDHKTEETMPPPNLFLQSRAVNHNMMLVFGICNYGVRSCYENVKPLEAEAPNKPAKNIMEIQATGKALVKRMGDVLSKLPEDESGSVFREEMKGLIEKANRWVVEVEGTFGDDVPPERVKSALGGLLGVEEGV
ncbi:MAG: hypothetical protein Q9183_006430 [Haloplaca sp. 2 TL-2023]